MLLHWNVQYYDLPLTENPTMSSVRGHDTCSTCALYNYKVLSMTSWYFQQSPATRTVMKPFLALKYFPSKEYSSVKMATDLNRNHIDYLVTDGQLSRGDQNCWYSYQYNPMSPNIIWWKARMWQRKYHTSWAERLCASYAAEVHVSNKLTLPTPPPPPKASALGNVLKKHSTTMK